MKKKRFHLILLGGLLWCLPQTHALSKGKINVVATSEDLASITREVGGKLVRVNSLARGGDNLHYLLARPSFALKLNRADLFVLVGMDMEVGWVPVLLQQARNSKVQRGNIGYCDASVGVPVLQKPTGLISRAMGDMHVFGNPHYWTDPVRGIVIAKNILDGLKRVDPSRAVIYDRNFAAFKQKIKKLFSYLKRIMRPHRGKKIVAYHNEFVYTADRFGLAIVGYIEPKPGVVPSPRHIQQISELIRSQKVSLIINTPWNIQSYPREVAERTGVKLLTLPIQTGSSKGADTYLKMLEKYIKMLAAHL